MTMEIKYWHIVVVIYFYEVVLNTDDKSFGGYGFADDSVPHLTNYDVLYAKQHKGWLKLYIPARSAVVLRKNK